MVDLAVETMATVREEIEPLLLAHYDEIALHKDTIKLDVDWGKYEGLERNGGLRVYTAREDGRLVGYSVFFLAWNMHYKSTLFGQNDVLYLTPEHRKGTTGLRLIKFSEDELRKDRVDKVVWHVKVANDWSAILERSGYQREEILMAKVL
jgi:GNAT superfamily N-acetyltransferase